MYDLVYLMTAVLVFVSGILFVDGCELLGRTGK